MTLLFYKLVQNFTNLWDGIYKNYVKKRDDFHVILNYKLFCNLHNFWQKLVAVVYLL